MSFLSGRSGNLGPLGWPLEPFKVEDVTWKGKSVYRWELIEDQILDPARKPVPENEAYDCQQRMSWFSDYSQRKTHRHFRGARALEFLLLLKVLGFDSAETFFE